MVRPSRSSCCHLCDSAFNIQWSRPQAMLRTIGVLVNGDAGGWVCIWVATLVTLSESLHRRVNTADYERGRAHVPHKVELIHFRPMTYVTHDPPPSQTARKA